MPRWMRRAMEAQQAGLLLVILLLGLLLTLFAGTHPDARGGGRVNNFLNVRTLVQTAAEASYFAIMAVGATLVIISAGIDLSVGAIYAFAGVGMALALRALEPMHLGAAEAVLLSLAVCLGIGLLCGLVNGLMVVGLHVHPFIITLGTMLIFRGIAFVISEARSIRLPDALMNVAKASLGLGAGLRPVPLVLMLGVTAAGALYLSRTVMGRHVYAVGGNVEASRFAGLRIGRILIGVYALSGLTAGIAAWLGGSFYGSAASGDADGYELFVIASAVVGGASLSGGKGSAFGAMLGAVLIALIRQAIRLLDIDTNYQWIIVGAAIIIAVVLDQTNARLALRRMARAAGPASANGESA